MGPTRRTAAVAVGVTLLAGACGYHKDATVVRLQDPGHCVPVDIAAPAVTAQLLEDTATRFNGSPSAKLRNGGCAFVRIEKVDSHVALGELEAGWPDTDTLGPAPIAWVPESTMWGQLLDARLTDAQRPPIAPNGTPFARSPLVVAMPAPMADALRATHPDAGWAELARLAGARGWGAYGHPDWGRFRLGKGNPNWSTTGLDQTVALDAAPAIDPRVLEQSVVYYGASTDAYFDNWRRLAQKSTASALTYLSAVVADERSVVAYNSGHKQTDTALDGHASRPKLPLVAVYPDDATIESDNPVIVLNAPWSSRAARAGARLFTRFALQPAAQAEVAAAGFRPARGPIRTDVLDARNGVDPSARISPVAPASPVEIEHALARWEVTRRPGRVLFLFDVSDSMGDPADPQEPGGPTKLAVAKGALTRALGELAPTDEIGLRIFSTDLTGSPSSDWRDVVPIAPLASSRRELARAIASLERWRGSPLYAATRDAFDTVARGADARRIDSVVLLTDGYNEDDRDTDLDALLAHVGTRPGVRVFTITFSNDADATTLGKLADATNAANFDASDPRDLPNMVSRALASQ
jgi:Ca-activated chloride channel homolog